MVEFATDIIHFSIQSGVSHEANCLIDEELPDVCHRAISVPCNFRDKAANGTWSATLNTIV